MTYTREDWSRSELAAIGNTSPTIYTLDWVIAWTQRETGPYSPQTPGAAFNLTNTTEPWKADGTAFKVTPFNNLANGQHVWNYASFADGIAANAKVLKNGDYPTLLHALQTNDETVLRNPPQAIEDELHLWGTGRVGASIAQMASNPSELRPDEQFPGDMTPAPAPPPQVQPQGGSVFELKNFVMVPERTPITADGHPPENAGLSCVPASICAGAMFLNGVQHIGGVYTPDSFKDQVYGQGTVGGENVAPYVPYLKTLGINLSSFKGNSAQLVAEAHKAIQAAMPVVFIEPNPYGNPQYTHCCVFFGEQLGFLTCLDPWIAQPVTHSDATWEQTLLTGEVWTMERITIALPDHLKQAGWQWDGHTLLCPAPHNTIPITGPWAEHILTRAIPWRVDDYVETAPVHLSPLEGSNPNIGPGQVMLFRFSGLEMKDGETRVFDMSVGAELSWLRAKFADLLAKHNALIAAVQSQQLPVKAA